MAETPRASQATPTPRPVRSAGVTPGVRPAPVTGPTRVLQNRAAPAQLSLFGRALPVR